MNEEEIKGMSNEAFEVFKTAWHNYISNNPQPEDVSFEYFVEVPKIEQFVSLGEGGIPIEPDTVTTGDHTTIAKELRTAARYLYGRMEDDRAHEMHRFSSLQKLSLPLSESELKQITKEALNNRLANLEAELETFSAYRKTQYKVQRIKMRDITTLAQKIPVIKNSPQGAAENSLRAIEAILKNHFPTGVPK
jgi:hypothetical protein